MEYNVRQRTARQVIEEFSRLHPQSSTDATGERASFAFTNLNSAVPAMNLRKPPFFLLFIGFTAAIVGFSITALAQAPKKENNQPHRPPNVILVLADDLGYGDAPEYSQESFPMPNLARLADQGMRFTDFCVASSVCSASRAALLTGRYGVRVGVPGVISANTNTALPSSELTLAERFRELGYATAIFGKWHLGNSPDDWPLRQGFDEWLGTIGSNDMGKGRPSLEARRQGQAGVEFVENDRIIETNPDQSQLTRRYTERAVDFIDRHRDRPFFLYVPHNMPHTPLFVSDRFAGRSGRGLYGDVLMEVDWSLGEIMRAVDEANLTEDTIILFTSDNGPWLIFGDHGGTSGPLSGGKKQTLEGGFRVPLVMRWPGKVPRDSVCSHFVTSLDLTPTLMNIVGGRTDDRLLDGRDVTPWWLGDQQATVAQKPFFYFWDHELQAVRWDHWKLRLDHIDTQAPDPDRIGYGGIRGGIKSVPRSQALFRLDQDPGETTDIAVDEPAMLNRLLELAEQGRQVP